MSTKRDSAGTGSANGFKRRLLIPVSNTKLNEQTSLMKNSRVLNLKDSLSVKNKYSEVNGILQSLEKFIQEHCSKNNQQNPSNNLPSSSSLKGFQYVKSKIFSYKQKKQQIIKPIVIGEEGLKRSKVQKLQLGEKDVSKILSELQTQNLQKAIKYLYSEKIHINQVIENLSYIVSLFLLNRIKNSRDGEQTYQFQNISGEEQNVQLFVKIFENILKEKTEQSQFGNQLKFSQIARNLTLKNIQPPGNQNQESQEILNLKNQISCLKKTIEEQGHSLKTNGDFQNKPTLCKKIEQAHSEIKSLYNEAIKLRNQEIIKLRKQLNEAQKTIKNQASLMGVISDSEKKQNKRELHKLQIKDEQFTQTVQRQFQKMRLGFKKKFEKIQVQFREKEHKMKQQIFNMEKQIQNLEWEKKLILKKYEFLMEDQQ